MPSNHIWQKRYCSSPRASGPQLGEQARWSQVNYGPYALNAVDSFFKILDACVPDVASLLLTEVLSKYEHCIWPNL